MSERITVYGGEFLALDSFGLFEPDLLDHNFTSDGVRALAAAIRRDAEGRVEALEVTAENLDAVLSGATEVANYHDDYAEGLTGAGPSAVRMGRQDREAMGRLSARIIARARKGGLVREARPRRAVAS
jgi:hypothetical protein